MTFHWLNHKGNKNLLVFFSGWGYDYRPFIPLKSDNYDVLMFYNYGEIILPPDFDLLFEEYEQVDLIAWSFGVWMANHLCANYSHKISTKMAINGTLNPISDSEGIPIDIFQGTIDNLSEANLKRFYRRMIGNPIHQSIFENHHPIILWEEAKEELSRMSGCLVHNSNKLFNKAIIADNDLIFSSKNQANFWINQVDIKPLSSSHFPFYNFHSWDVLLNF